MDFAGWSISQLKQFLQRRGCVILRRARISTVVAPLKRRTKAHIAVPCAQPVHAQDRCDILNILRHHCFLMWSPPRVSADGAVEKGDLVSRAKAAAQAAGLMIPAVRYSRVSPSLLSDISFRNLQEQRRGGW